MLCRQGLRLSLGFFSDVLVPKHALQSGSTWEAEEDGGVWVWPCAGNSFYMDIGEIIRFRVTSVRFNPQPRVSHQVSRRSPHQDKSMPSSVLAHHSVLQRQAGNIRFVLPAETTAKMLCVSCSQEIEDDSGNHVGSAGNPYAPMEVLGDINEDGLGCISWWGTGEDVHENGTTEEGDDAAMPDAEE